MIRSIKPSAMKIHFAPILLLLQLLVKVEGGYDLSVTIISYNNSGEICNFCGINGCCGGSSCGNCDNIFLHCCLREFGSTSTSDNCQFMDVSDVRHSTSEMDFNRSSFNLSPSNPFTLQGITTQWTGVQLLMEGTDGSTINTHGSPGVGANDRFHINIESAMSFNTLVTGTYHAINRTSIIKLSYKISCTSGSNCFDRCWTADCGPGTCVTDSMSYSYTCMCPSGHFGDECSSQEYCHGINCNRGTCEALDNGYRCNCDPGFSGSACEIGICLDYCMNGGTCVLMDSSPKCNCHYHYIGTRCEMMDFCADVECSRNSSCKVIENSFTCECDPGFTGANCELPDLCVGIDCGNGTCRNVVGDFSCECMAGYTGELCEAECEDIISCSSEVPGGGLVLLDLVKIVGGGGGGLVVAVLLLLMVLVVIVVRTFRSSRKKSDKNAGEGKPTNLMPNDNPIYMLANQSERTLDNTEKLNVHLGENMPVRNERPFLNPIHEGSESDDYEVPGCLSPATTSTFEVPRNGGMPCLVKPASAPASYEVPRSSGMPCRVNPAVLRSGVMPCNVNPASAQVNYEVPRSSGMPCSVKPASAPVNYEVPRSGGMSRSPDRKVNPASASVNYEVPRSSGMPCSVNPASAPVNYEVPRSGGMSRSPDRKVKSHGPYPLPYEKPISRITPIPNGDVKDPIPWKKLPTSPPQTKKKPMLPPVPRQNSKPPV